MWQKKLKLREHVVSKEREEKLKEFTENSDYAILEIMQQKEVIDRKLAA